MPLRHQQTWFLTYLEFSTQNQNTNKHTNIDTTKHHHYTKECQQIPQYTNKYDKNTTDKAKELLQKQAWFPVYFTWNF